MCGRSPRRAAMPRSMSGAHSHPPAPNRKAPASSRPPAAGHPRRCSPAPTAATTQAVLGLVGAVGGGPASVLAAEFGGGGSSGGLEWQPAHEVGGTGVVELEEGVAGAGAGHRGATGTRNLGRRGARTAVKSCPSVGRRPRHPPGRAGDPEENMDPGRRRQRDRAPRRLDHGDHRNADLSSPKGMRLIVRKGQSHPGAQQRLTGLDDLRLTCFDHHQRRIARRPGSASPQAGPLRGHLPRRTETPETSCLPSAIRNPRTLRPDHEDLRTTCRDIAAGSGEAASSAARTATPEWMTSTNGFGVHARRPGEGRQPPVRAPGTHGPCHRRPVVPPGRRCPLVPGQSAALR